MVFCAPRDSRFVMTTSLHHAFEPGPLAPRCRLLCSEFFLESPAPGRRNSRSGNELLGKNDKGTDCERRSIAGPDRSGSRTRHFCRGAGLDRADRGFVRSIYILRDKALRCRHRAHSRRADCCAQKHFGDHVETSCIGIERSTIHSRRAAQRFYGLKTQSLLTPHEKVVGGKLVIAGGDYPSNQRQAWNFTRFNSREPRLRRSNLRRKRLQTQLLSLAIALQWVFKRIRHVEEVTLCVTPKKVHVTQCDNDLWFRKA